QTFIIVAREPFTVVFDKSLMLCSRAFTLSSRDAENVCSLVPQEVRRDPGSTLGGLRYGKRPGDPFLAVTATQVSRRASHRAIGVQADEEADVLCRITERRHLITRRHAIVCTGQCCKRRHRRISNESGDGTLITPWSSVARKNSDDRSPT